MKQTSQVELPDGSWRRICDTPTSILLRVLAGMDTQEFGDYEPTYYAIRTEIKNRGLKKLLEHKSNQFLNMPQKEIGACPHCHSEALAPAQHIEGYNCLHCGHTFSLDRMITLNSIPAGVLAADSL